MLYTSNAIALLCALATGSVIKRAPEPCPYHRLDDRPSIKDEYIVRLRKEHSIDQHFQFLGRNLSQHAAKFSHMRAINTYTVLIDEETMHNEIRYDPGIEWVSHNMALRPNLHWYDDKIEEMAQPRRHSKRWSTLNVMLDWWTRMSVKWNKENSIIEGNKEKADILQDSGKGVDIYIMDSGIRITHEVFKVKDRGGARNFHKKYVDEDFGDLNGHGTFVAGMAHLNAPWATVVNVKIFGEGESYGKLVEAINDIILEHNDRKGDLDIANNPDWRGSVINMSWEEPDAPVFRSLIGDAIKGGIQVVTSAGNNGEDGGTPPCEFQDVICVGAVTKSYTKLKKSNYGTHVTIYAPGEALQGPGHTADNSYVRKSGTSFAAAAVSAVVSIFVSFENIRDTSATVRDRLMKNAHKDILVDETDNKALPNILAHTGLEHPDRKNYWPYVGLSDGQTVPDDEVDNTNGFSGSVDGSDLPTFASPDGEPTEVEDSDELSLGQLTPNPNGSDNAGN